MGKGDEKTQPTTATMRHTHPNKIRHPPAFTSTDTKKEQQAAVHGVWVSTMEVAQKPLVPGEVNRSESQLRSVDTFVQSSQGKGLKKHGEEGRFLSKI